MKKFVMLIAMSLIIPASGFAQDKCFSCTVSAGPLKVQMDGAAVVKALGEPAKKGKFQLQQADGSYSSKWSWADKGVSIDMEADAASGAKAKVFNIYLTLPCSLKLGDNIGIGSTEADVKKAYAKNMYVDKDMPAESTVAGKQFVAGNPYDGILFVFKDGKVQKITIGSWGAE